MKARPEVDRLYRKLRAHTNDEFTFDTFRLFMIEKQKVRRNTCAFIPN